MKNNAATAQDNRSSSYGDAEDMTASHPQESSETQPGDNADLAAAGDEAERSAAQSSDSKDDSTHNSTEPAARSGEADDPHLSDEIVTLIEDLKTYVETEVAYGRAMSAFLMDRAKAIIISALVAVVVLVVAVIALVLGLVLALAPLVTPWGATAIVVGILLLVAIIVGLRARSAVKELSRTFSDSDAAKACLNPLDRQTLNFIQTAEDEAKKSNEQD